MTEQTVTFPRQNNTLNHPPKRRRNPSKSQSKSADFSAKQVPSALDLSPRPQTHLPFGCSAVGVMWKPKISLNFQKKNHLSVSTWSLSCTMAVSGGGPVVHALLCTWAGGDSIPRPIFCAFLVTCPDKKIGFQCTNKACQKKMNAHRLPISISLCAGWVCSSDLQPKLSCGSQSDGKIVFACTNKPCTRRQMHTGIPLKHCEHINCKLPPDQHQGTCPAEKFDHWGTMNPRGPEMCLFVGSKNTSWCPSEEPT